MRKVVAVIVSTLFAVACGGSGDDDAASGGSSASTSSAETESDVPGTTAPPATTEAPATTAASTTTTTTTTIAAAVADAILIEPGVDARLGTATVFSPLTDPEPVAVGDTVRTDRTGYAEIAYFEGSRTRLDVDTEFEVLELVDDVDESLVRTRMGVGRTWHRVESLGESGEFSVETSVATAVVQGTAFSIECRTETSCTFMVVEGALAIELGDGTVVDLVAPAALVVDAVDGAGDPVPVPFDGAFGDEWLFDNAGRDVEAAFTPAAEVYQAYGPSFGSISGTFIGTRTVVGRECEAACAGAPVGDVADRTYTFELDCAAGIPCVGTIDTEYTSSGEVARVTMPVAFDGTAYRWELRYENFLCTLDTDGDGANETESGKQDVTIEWRFTPTAAEIIDGRWVVTAMSGDGSAANVVTEPGNCPWGDEFQTSEFEVTRAP